MADEALHHKLRELARSNQELNAKVDKLLRDLASINSVDSSIKTLDDIPGERIPKWYKIAIDFDEGITTPLDGSVEIEPDGPFVCEQMQPYWRVGPLDSDGVTVQNGDGLTLPTTSFANARQLTDATASTASWGRTASPTATVINNIPEMEYRVQIQSSGRFWTGQQKIPAAAFYGFGSGPLYLAAPGIVETSDRLRLHVDPVIATPVKGTLIMVFHGYQILNSKVRVTDILSAR